MTVILDIGAELNGSHAKMFLYIFPEEGRIGKSHDVADLLDAIVGLSQIVADVFHHSLLDPVIGSLA